MFEVIYKLNYHSLVRTLVDLSRPIKLEVGFGCTWMDVELRDVWEFGKV